MVNKRGSKWSGALRRKVVADAEASDEPISEMAKRHGLNPKLLYSWRQKILRDREVATGKEVCLLPVEVKAAPDETPVQANNPASSGFLEIDLPCGSKLRCGSDLYAALLKMALTELRPHTAGTDA